MILLDTHALIWWVNESAKLSKKAKKAIDNTLKTDQICISSITIWEVCVLFKKNQLKLSMDIHEWIKKVVTLPMIKVVDVDASIATQSVFLSNYQPSDSADRIIIATAQLLKIPLVTADKRITKSKIVETVW